MGGGAGVLPVATMTRGARMRSPSTTTTPGSSNVASPITSRRPGSDSRYARAPFAPRSTMPWTRSMTAPMSTRRPSTWMP